MPALRNLAPMLARVQKPARYTGGEWNSVEIELREDRSLEEQGFPSSPVYTA